ncbi:GAF domain-containing protein [Anaerorhabdus furcosa]|uniref:GAF domain-containing protein n=1 Tax=Anaerorhabdus furcosa TaxID=118967 RepID=A0A1T4JU52_9FIRM|nr:GAF domain-containing protein [Anaerorhabdus furcosa]SJZ33635.1 GAF domain-containing protein [Anaerorhabdus furcosa]
MIDYPLLNSQVEALLEETDKIAALANLTACINESLDNINWVGFYFLTNNELVLGPFQGKVACTHISLDRGVCGKAASTKTIQIIKNVHEFKGHIACDSASESELVIPILVNDDVVGLLDIDSPSLNRFSERDAVEFEMICKLISEAYLLHNWK